MKVKQYEDWPKDKQLAARQLAEKGIFYPYFLGRQREIYKMFHSMEQRGSMAAVLSRKQGKSYIALLLEMEMCIRHPGFISRHMLPNLKQARDVVYPIISELRNTLPSSVLPFSINRSDGIIRFKNGSMIVIGGMSKENIDSSRGPRSDGIIFDEIGFTDNNISDYKYAMYSVLLPQLTVSSFGYTVYITTPPHDPSHPFLTLSLPPIKSSGKYIEYTIYDSPFLNEEDIKELAESYGGLDSPDFKREMLCQVFALQERRVTPEFTKEKHMREVEPRPEHTCYQSADIGLTDNTAILGGYFDYERQKLVVTNEHTIKGKSLGELAEIIKDEQKKLEPYMYNKAHIRACYDVFEIAAYTLRVDHQMVFQRPVKRKVEDNIAILRKWLQEEKIEISKDCVNTLYELEFGCWSDSHTVNKEFERTANGHLDHIAALMYMVRLVNPRFMPGTTTDIDLIF
jgi:hypothetical protein